MEPHPDEVVVAVMGITGSGKSSFIKTVTGNNSIYIGHGLESGTSEVLSYRFTHKGTRYVLIDTPGFNDSNVSDEDVMNRILDWLHTSFRAGTRLNGLIYIHRIIDPRMQGSALSNMRMFRQLCGSACFPNIILATTFWDDVPAHVGNRREEELKTAAEFWGDLVKKGSRVVRLGRRRDEGLKVLEMLTGRGKVTLRAQDELMNEHKARQDTAAAQTAYSDPDIQWRELLRQAKIMAKKQLEDQKRAMEEQLSIERDAQRASEYLADCIEKEERREMEWRSMREFDHKQDALRALRVNQERTRREEQRLENERRNAERKRASNELRLKEEKAAYYASYVCGDARQRAYLLCPKCDKSWHAGNYYHCCVCRRDCDQCMECGSRCPVDGHPRMKTKTLQCIVM